MRVVGSRALLIQESQLVEVQASLGLERPGALLVAADSSAGQNPASQFPLAELAPYASQAYRWNPTGQDLMTAAMPFSLVQLDGNSTNQAQRRAAGNQQQVRARHGRVASDGAGDVPLAAGWT